MFQRYLIVYLTIVTLISTCIILPININGNAFTDKSKFSSTTIVNIDASSGRLWIHCTISWLFLVILFIFMRHLSARMHYKESELVSRTVIILNIPKDKCDLDLIRRYFNETYTTDLEIVDIQLAYDTSKIDELHKKRNAMRVGKETSLDFLNNNGKRPKMYPFHFGSLFELCSCTCCACCGCKNKLQTIDAIDYYTDREAYLNELINQETHLSFEKPLGFAFVTFKDEEMSDK
jgi:calcium permeable stress-gated cation channel